MLNTILVVIAILITFFMGMRYGAYAFHERLQYHFQSQREAQVARWIAQWSPNPKWIIWGDEVNPCTFYYGIRLGNFHIGYYRFYCPPITEKTNDVPERPSTH